jgi:hypothetical protein
MEVSVIAEERECVFVQAEILKSQGRSGASGDIKWARQNPCGGNFAAILSGV